MFIFEKALVLSMICSKCENEDEKISKEEESIEICQEIRLKSIDETRNYFIKEIGQNELISKKKKKVCTTSFFGYWMHFNLSVFVSLLGTPIGIMSFAVGLKFV